MCIFIRCQDKILLVCVTFIIHIGLMSLTSKALIGVSVLCFLVFITAGCAAPRHADRNDPLLGTWKTERGIIMTVQMKEEKGAEASIKLAPGFIGDDFKIGKVIISAIKPAPDGGWTGLFIMPGNLRPVKVDISVFSWKKMLIISRDKSKKK